MPDINTSKPVIILGAGGHAKVVADALNQSGVEILGFMTNYGSSKNSLLGYTFLGNDKSIINYSPDEIMLVNGVGALPHKKHRCYLTADMREKGYSFLRVIHPTAIISDDIKLAEGVQVLANSVIQPGSRVNMDCIINTGTIVDHDCVIEENCHLAPGVVCSGGVKVGKGTHLGTGTIVIENISIGSNSVIAAGSVVYRDIPDNVIFIQKRDTQSEINKR